MIPRGRLIVFESSDGAGKSTQIRLLAYQLRANGKEVSELREPGGTPFGEKIRTTVKQSAEFISPRAELLAMNASRAQLVDTVITPALNRGTDVLLDRFYHSTVAYQGYGRQLPLDMVEAVIGAAIGTLRPDHVVLLRLPVEECLARRRARQGTSGPDRFERETVDFYRRVEQGYDAIAKGDPAKVHVVDATRTIEDIHNQICEILW